VALGGFRKWNHQREGNTCYKPFQHSKSPILGVHTVSDGREKLWPLKPIRREFFGINRSAPKHDPINDACHWPKQRNSPVRDVGLRMNGAGYPKQHISDVTGFKRNPRTYELSCSTDLLRRKQSCLYFSNRNRHNEFKASY
jgi:hypothetical protein